MKAYVDMISEVTNFGTRKENRTGVDTISTFGHYYELCFDHAMAFQGRDHHHVLPPAPVDGTTIPLLTTKKISWKNIVVEMLWFLSGETNIEFLRRHRVKIWEPWADEHGEVPSAYGHFWREYPAYDGQVRYVDQLGWVLNQLRERPMNRRLVVSAWEPQNAETSKLPPCHFAMAFNVQNNRDGEPRLCLHLTQRSCDLALGVPYNMASYGLLLAIMSHLSGIEPGIFAHTLLDLHIYTSKPDGSMADYDHLPGLLEQARRIPKPLPTVLIHPSIRELGDIEALLRPEVGTDRILSMFKLEGYDPWPAIPFKVAV